MRKLTDLEEAFVTSMKAFAQNWPETLTVTCPSCGGVESFVISVVQKDGDTEEIATIKLGE